LVRSIAYCLKAEDNSCRAGYQAAGLAADPSRESVFDTWAHRDGTFEASKKLQARGRKQGKAADAKRAEDALQMEEAKPKNAAEKAAARNTLL